MLGNQEVMLMSRAVEIAREFPHVQVIVSRCHPYTATLRANPRQGIDLAPVQNEHQKQIPDNCHFVMEDVAKGLPYSDGYFDVVYLRALVAGVSYPTQNQAVLGQEG